MVCVLGAVVFVVVAVLAAGTLCWRHEPFNVQLNPIGGMVGSLPRPPPIGLTCESKGPRAQDAFTETEVGLTARRRPDAPMAPRIRRRRDPEGARLSLRAVAAQPAPKSHATSNT